ncbi:MAG: uroporphyrinogen decarboxylase family protein [Chitinivibrionales bacterium]|nr:uroporphyrinogen decarboxylase family protein [Chitinivibrionales bacterium]
MNTLRADLLRCLRREGFKKIPVDYSLCESQIKAFEKRFGHADYETYLGLSHRRLALKIKKNFADGRQLFKREEVPAGTEFDEYGIGHSKGSELAFHMTRMHHPLRGADPEEVLNYPYPTVDESNLKEFTKKVSALHEKGLASFGFMQMTIWEASWYLRSMEELMMDMMMESESAVILFDKITDFACAKARAYASAGIDILSLGDDIGTQTSLMLDVGLWENWLRPRLKKVIQAAKAIKPDILIFYHSCGYIIPFIDKLIETGVEILNPIQPECMEFNEIHDRFGDRVSFWGTLGTQQLLPYGSKEEVKKVTLERLNKCGGKGGIVIGPTHLVEPEVPWKNLMAIIEAAKEFEGSAN